MTPDGYTQLPADMRGRLGLERGGYLWFLRSAPEGRWEAWTEPELDEQFGADDPSPKGT